VNKENYSAVVKPSYLELLVVNKIIPLTEGGSVIDNRTFYLSFDVEVSELMKTETNMLFMHIHTYTFY
jgi:hypothetical protein